MNTNHKRFHDALHQIMHTQGKEAWAELCASDIAGLVGIWPLSSSTDAHPCCMQYEEAGIWTLPPVQDVGVI